MFPQNRPPVSRLRYYVTVDNCSHTLGGIKWGYFLQNRTIKECLGVSKGEAIFGLDWVYRKSSKRIASSPKQELLLFMSLSYLAFVSGNSFVEKNIR